MAYTDENGKVINLGKKIAQGGEGTVYNCSTSSRLVAKIYNQNKLSPKKAQKLEVMCNLYDNEIAKFSAWVKTVIYENGNAVGFLMEKITQYEEIHLLYGTTDDRQKYFPNAEWKFMVHAALNLAIAVDTLHQKGIVIGDINQSNILVNDQAEIKLIDCDSYQVEHNGKTYICEVGVPEYTSPELQGCSFKNVIRDQNHDCFGLAVMIFKILFFAKHPYSGCNAPSEIENAIKGDYFCYARNYGYKTPIYSPMVRTLLNDELQDLFERAFCNSKSRPTADEWVKALEKFEKDDVIKCSGNNSHFYNKNSNQCIWCALEKSGLHYFDNAPAPVNPPSKTKSKSSRNLSYITCSSCGYKYQNINNTCPVCGYNPNLANSTSTTYSGSVVNYALQNAPQNTKTAKRDALIILFVCIALISRIITADSWFNSTHNNNYQYNNTNTVSESNNYNNSDDNNNDDNNIGNDNIFSSDEEIQEQERKNAENAQRRIDEEKAQKEHVTQQNVNKPDTTNNSSTAQNSNNNTETKKKDWRESWNDGYMWYNDAIVHGANVEIPTTKKTQSFAELNNQARPTPHPLQKTTTPQKQKIDVEKEARENEAYLFE